MTSSVIVKLLPKMTFFWILFLLNFSIQASSHSFKVVFLLGRPASGKSTVSAKLVNDFGCTHLSAGELLRQERESGSETANLIETYMKEGSIVPVSITLNLLRKAMEKSSTSSLPRRFIIDGFPRNVDNLDGWNKEMSECAKVESVLFLECPEEECTRRIEKRALISGRIDDNLDTLKKRFRTFKEEGMKVIQYYDDLHSQQNQRLVTRINGDRDEESVYADVKSLFHQLIAAEVLQEISKLIATEDADTGSLALTQNAKLTGNLSLSDLMIRNGVLERPSRMSSKILSPSVRFLTPTSSLVTCVRLIQIMTNQGEMHTLRCEESRVFQYSNHAWVNSFTHRTGLP